MDYTGSCWAAFTAGQVARMRFNIENNRTSLVGNAAIACTNQSLPANEIGVADFVVNSEPCSPVATISTVTVNNNGSSTLQNFTLEILVKYQVLIKRVVLGAIFFC